MISKRQVLILSASIIAVCLVVQQCVGSDNGLESESDAGTGSAGEEAAVSGGGRPGEVDSSPAPDSAATAAAEDGATRRELPQISPELIYKGLLRQKRLAHREAVKTILQLDDYEKQHKMVTLLLDKLFKIVTDSKVKLISSGLTPGDPFPTNETLRDAFSSVLENTAFFGDMVLRLPDIVHDIMKRNREWELIMRWSLGFCNTANIFEDKEATLIHLVSQEMGIIEKEEDYVNPYKKQAKKDSIAQLHLKEELKKQKVKKRKERKRGPRLSPHTEL